jgi:phage terminase large subunit GpA-like protein
VTIAADFQAKDNRYPYAVDAWGPDRRSATIAYGECTSLDQLAAEVLARAWPHADGGPPLRCQAALLDAGNRPQGIYEFCDRMRAAGVWAWACKGSSRALTTDYERSTLGKHTTRPGTVLIHVDTIRSQDWIERAINYYQADVGGGFALHGGTLDEHRDFLEQLLNEQPVEHLDRNNMGRESWQRIEKTTPNDYRDVKRYNFVAMLLATRGGRIFPRDYTPPAPQTDEPGRIRPLKFRR